MGNYITRDRSLSFGEGSNQQLLHPLFTLQKKNKERKGKEPHKPNYYNNQKKKNPPLDTIFSHAFQWPLFFWKKKTQKTMVHFLLDALSRLINSIQITAD